MLAFILADFRIDNETMYNMTEHLIKDESLSINISIPNAIVLFDILTPINIRIFIQDAETAEEKMVHQMSIPELKNTGIDFGQNIGSIEIVALVPGLAHIQAIVFPSECENYRVISNLNPDSFFLGSLFPDYEIGGKKAICVWYTEAFYQIELKFAYQSLPLGVAFSCSNSKNCTELRQKIITPSDSLHYVKFQPNSYNCLDHLEASFHSNQTGLILKHMYIPSNTANWTIIPIDFTFDRKASPPPPRATPTPKPFSPTTSPTPTASSLPQAKTAKHTEGFILAVMGFIAAICLSIAFFICIKFNKKEGANEETQRLLGDYNHEQRPHQVQPMYFQQPPMYPMYAPPPPPQQQQQMYPGVYFAPIPEAGAPYPMYPFQPQYMPQIQTPIQPPPPLPQQQQQT